MGRPKGSTNKPKPVNIIPEDTMDDSISPDRMADATRETIEMRVEPARAALPVVQQHTAVTPMGMLDRAVTSGASLEVIRGLMDLNDRWEAQQARKAFDRAMADAKAEIPTITKNRTVDFTSQRGRTNYRYEDMESVASAVGPALSKFGLSYRYRATSNVGEPVTVTCIISHRDGHFEELTLAAGRDDSGNKNSIQAISSTMTYLQRISLKAALGLAVSNDDDGQTSEEKPKDNGPPRRAEPPRDVTPPRREDPISTGPQPKPQAAKTEAKPSTAAPYKIPGTGETYESWARKYCDAIKAAPDVATIYGWVDMNSEPLGKLGKGAPETAANVRKATLDAMAALRKTKEPAKKASDMDDAAPVDPEQILGEIDRELAAVEVADDLQSVWDSACEPLMAKITFPMDQDAAQGIFRKHEARLSG